MNPDKTALRRLSTVRPAWIGLAEACVAVGLGPRTVLHAGPPYKPDQNIPKPVLSAAAVAAVFEGWADSLAEAHVAIADGEVDFRPAQDCGVVTPLAAVVSGSMQLQVIEDLSGSGRPAYAPLNGGMQNDLRFGVADEQTLERLHFLNDSFATEISGTLSEPIPLLPIADEALEKGDDCHGKTANATRLLNSVIANHFLATADSFFLNLWMAASKCIMSAAEGTPASSIVTAMAGNGCDFGIQIAGLPGLWHTVPATPPVLQGGNSALMTPLNATGDSAIIETFGLGGMYQAGVRSDLKRIDHPDFNHVSVRAGFSANDVIGKKQPPIVSLGVLDAAGVNGLVARGFYSPPLPVFQDALNALRKS